MSCLDFLMGNFSNLKFSEKFVDLCTLYIKCVVLSEPYRSKKCVKNDTHCMKNLFFIEWLTLYVKIGIWHTSSILMAPTWHTLYLRQHTHFESVSFNSYNIWLLKHTFNSNSSHMNFQNYDRSRRAYRIVKFLVYILDIYC